MLLTKLNFVYIIISLKLAYLLGHDLYLHNDLLWVRQIANSFLHTAKIPEILFFQLSTNSTQLKLQPLQKPAKIQRRPPP